MPVEKPGFRRGLRALFGGLGWLLTTPRAWPLAAVPFLIALTIVGGLGYATWVFVPDWVSANLGAPEGWFTEIAYTVLAYVAVLLGWILSVVLGLALAQPLSGPALEGLVRQKEGELGAPPRPKSALLTEIWRSLQSLLVGYAFGLPALALRFSLSLIVPAASVVLFPLKLFVAATMAAWDICDYPLSVRGISVGERVATLKRNKGAVLGFGFGLALAGLIPLMLFLLLPAGVAGATRLLHEIEVYERQSPPEPV
jgi:CysZ protein